MILQTCLLLLWFWLLFIKYHDTFLLKTTLSDGRDLQIDFDIELALIRLSLRAVTHDWIPPNLEVFALERRCNWTHTEVHARFLEIGWPYRALASRLLMRRHRIGRTDQLQVEICELFDVLFQVLLQTTCLNEASLHLVLLRRLHDRVENAYLLLKLFLLVII